MGYGGVFRQNTSAAFSLHSGSQVHLTNCSVKMTESSEFQLDSDTTFDANDFTSVPSSKSAVRFADGSDCVIAISENFKFPAIDKRIGD